MVGEINHVVFAFSNMLEKVETSVLHGTEIIPYTSLISHVT